MAAFRWLSRDGSFGVKTAMRTIRKLKSAAGKVKRGFETAWIRSLFPWTEQPDEFSHRLQRIALAPLNVDGQPGGIAICRFIYPEIDGSIQAGTVKFYLPAVLKKDPRRRVPLLHNAGYEIDEGAALAYLREGIVVSTVHDHPLNPLSRGPKLEWALMHAMRGLVFVDDTRVMVQGISTGGNMALLSAAETFPVACAMPIVPLFNLAYNLAYLIRTLPLACSRRPSSGKPWLPVLASVAGLPEQAAERFGSDPESDAYFELSPVRLADGITAPVAVVFCTGDVLVPIEQVDLEWSRPIKAGGFPEGYTRQMCEILKLAPRRLRLMDVIDAEKREVYFVTIPGTAEKKSVGGQDGIGTPLEVPFSRARQWSIAIIEDGAPERRFGHFKHYHAPDYTSFRRWAIKESIPDGQLTLRKLTWLMKRYAGEQPLNFVVNPSLRPAHPAQLLDFPAAERADVLRGLCTFARSDAAAYCLARLYTELPERLKVFGDSLGTGSAESVRQVLELLTAKAGAR